MPATILAAVRTPLGAFGGALRGVGTVRLAEACLRGLREALTPGAAVREAHLGCALGAGLGPNPALAALRAAGFPGKVPARTVSAGEASGLLAVIQAAESLERVPTGILLAGGADAPTDVPYLLPAARWGLRVGSPDLLDGLLVDAPAPWPPAPSGAFRALPAPEAPVDRRGRRGQARLEVDEPAAPDCPWTDGAALLALAPPDAPSPLARILGHGVAAGAPEGPEGAARALEAALAMAGAALGDLDVLVLEGRQACLAPALRPRTGPGPRLDLLGGPGLPPFPPGALGALLAISLVHALADGDLRAGAAVLATRDGLGAALILERA